MACTGSSSTDTAWRGAASSWRDRSKSRSPCRTVPGPALRSAVPLVDSQDRWRGVGRYPPVGPCPALFSFLPFPDRRRRAARTGGGGVQAGWLALCVALLGACGQGSPAREPADASTVPVVVTVTPSSVSLSPGASVQFTASVPVTWSIPAGIAGSIDPSGRYTAPLAPGSYRVVATSVDDPRTSVTAAVAVISSGPIEVSIDPPAATIDSGGTVPFTATVTGGQDGAVVWSADAGTVDQTGLYTAPLTGGTVHVTAVSRADPSASATAVVSVRSATVHL